MGKNEDKTKGRKSSKKQDEKAKASRGKARSKRSSSSRYCTPETSDASDAESEHYAYVDEVSVFSKASCYSSAATTPNVTPKPRKTREYFDETQPRKNKITATKPKHRHTMKKDANDEEEEGEESDAGDEDSENGDDEEESQKATVCIQPDPSWIAADGMDYNVGKRLELVQKCIKMGFAHYVRGAKFDGVKWEGWGRVYLIRHGAREDVYKVGFTTLSADERWKSEKCKPPGSTVVYDSGLFYGAEFVEKVVHAYFDHVLFERNGCSRCTKKHKEWFRADMDKLIECIEAWKVFAMSRMYTSGLLDSAKYKVFAQALFEPGPARLVGLLAAMDLLRDDQLTPPHGTSERKAPGPIRMIRRSSTMTMKRVNSGLQSVKNVFVININKMYTGPRKLWTKNRHGPSEDEDEE